jgi:hypothetical protein
MIKSKMRIPSSMPKTSSKSPGKPRQTFQNETGITTAVKSTNLNDAPMIPYEPSYKCQPAYDVHGNATGECVIPPKQNKQGAFYVGGQTRFSK